MQKTESGDANPINERGHAPTCPAPEVLTASNYSYSISGNSQAEISQPLTDSADPYPRIYERGNQTVFTYQDHPWFEYHPIAGIFPPMRGSN